MVNFLLWCILVEKDEYDRLRRIPDEDRMEAEHARLEMERHVADHQC